MRNPYDVLGVPQGAAIEQVNAAYRELMRKYQDSGNQKKIDEINEAYDSIVMGAPSGGSGYSSGGYSQYGSADYSDIRAKINSGRLDDAQILLDGIPEGSRDAQWYYLKGTVQQKRGWLEEAAKNFATASNLDPSNNTYKMAYNKVNNARSGGYRTERRAERDSSDCSGCDICSGLLCADCCCECFGGDLIPCC
ncbi:MAG: DnaJ domain-containing protein [Acutalibacteraceae bacterium]